MASKIYEEYLAMKEKHKESIVMFRLGDFYEMFDDDAIKVSKLLNLTLTGRDIGETERKAMCGIPCAAAEIYEKKLNDLGMSVVFPDVDERKVEKKKTLPPNSKFKEMGNKLLRETVERLKDPDEWANFLRCMGRNYNLGPHNQILLFAQAPNATAILELEKWNRVFGRWVNKGEKSIKLIKNEAGLEGTAHLFDISQTKETRYSREVPIFERSQVDDSVLIDFTERYVGAFQKHLTVAKALDDLCSKILDSELDGVEKTENEELLRNSFKTLILNRLDESSNATFESVRNISNSDVLELVDGVNQLSKTVLKEMSENILKNKKEINNYERKQADGVDLHRGGRIFTSGLRDRRDTLYADKVGENAPRIPRDAEPQGISQTSVFAPIDKAFSNLPRGSGEKDRGAHQNDGGVGERDGGAESGRSTQVGSSDEQYKIQSRGNSDKGTHRSVTGYTEQLNFFEEKEQRSSKGKKLIHITADELKAIVKRGSCFAEGKFRIQKYFSEVHTLGEQASFLKEEYGTGGIYPVFEREKQALSLNHSPSHIEISIKLDREKTERFSWSEWAFEVNNLVHRGDYLSAAESAKYIDWLEKRAAPISEEVSIEEQSDVSELSQNNYEEYIGKELIIDDRKYIVDEINENSVSLQDITFKANTGFPIFRREEKSFVVNYFKKLDEIAKSNETDKGENYKITDVKLGEGTPRERFRNNIEAIKIVKACTSENRAATKAEKEKLAEYVGWGGLSEAFDDEGAWANENRELRSILSEEELSSARESSLTAFYTPPYVAEKMYDCLNSMGLKRGNLLEPSMGTGTFFGTNKNSNIKMHGVELDVISGNISKLLYPQSSVSICGFEKTDFPNNFFDVAIGNVPFGQFKVNDKKYNKHNFLIHDYFFAKALDKVAPGGVIAFITSQGTLDKSSQAFRKYLSERAELLGAVRLPDDTFTKSAGTRVTSDIIFLQKRESLSLGDDSWVKLGRNDNGIEINNYFIENPHMVLGEMKMESGPFGPQANCKATSGDLEEKFDRAIGRIKGEIKEKAPYTDTDTELEERKSIPADVNVKNFSYTLVDDDIYYRENNLMLKEKLNEKTQERVSMLIEMRDVLRDVISYQLNDFPVEDIESKQFELNEIYDNFQSEYGYINTKENAAAFAKDSSFYLLCSLESKNGDESYKKSDIFYKRTIRPKVKIEKVDTAMEALTLSINEKAKIDFDYMTKLTDKSKEELLQSLKGSIYRVPSYTAEEYQPLDEYLSGNVREKLVTARHFAERDKRFLENVKALEKVLPKDLAPSEISVRLGATWISPNDYKEFLFDLLDTPRFCANRVDVVYSKYTGEWNVIGKSEDRGNVKSNQTYGTSRVNAYKLFENALNLRETKVFDSVLNEFGEKKNVLNKKETAIASSKQDLIKEKFVEWIWNDPERRERLGRLYNDKFNNIRPREYDGENLQFYGMSNEVELKKHQKDAVARMLHGGNTLLAHVVGAGKTFEMVAAAEESKRLGLSNKALFVVPNHLTEQWAGEYMSLYPTANILVATKKDFETKSRKKFIGQIATGDYDAIIIGHSQFEKIPLSEARQKMELERQREEILLGIKDLKSNQGERFSIKALERTKKNIDLRLQKLNDTSRKDDVITFEELGVDKLFVDEAHYYKNLYLHTKMRNVAGIAQTEAMKSSDLFMKCRYLDEITEGKGIVFATGTPISNSMVELYTMQRHLQYSKLKASELEHFDAWASTFGETQTAIELAPEGTGYRAKTRFSKFHNLPELISMFKEVADIKTADMLDLPVPKANYHIITVKPTLTQKDIILSLADRAEAVRNRRVEPNVDNMLKITNDGRKVALDQRLFNPLLADEEGTKVNACAENVFRIYKEGEEGRTTQLIFSDLSTPSQDRFNVYDDLKGKLIEKGIPKNEIAFIHDANTELKKSKLFDDVRSGKVRVLMGSTQKMGAGTNVQERLIALHDLDCPWRPSDLEQRSGRIVRQGNKNKEVEIFRYVTEETFDAYLYQLIENKQKFISQIMTSKAVVRSAEDVDEAVLSYAEIKMLATGNPMIKEKMDLDIQVAKLRMLKQNYLAEKYALEDFVYKQYPKDFAQLSEMKVNIEKDVEELKGLPKSDEFSGMIIGGQRFAKKDEAGLALLEVIKKTKGVEPKFLGEYKGFKLECTYESYTNNHTVRLKGHHSYFAVMGEDSMGNITRIDNAIKNIPNRLITQNEKIEALDKQFFTAKEELKKPFDKDEELTEKQGRLKELDVILSFDGNEENELNKVNEKESNAILDF